MLLISRGFGGLVVDLEDERLRARFRDSEGILDEVLLGGALDLVSVLLEELVEIVRIEGRRLDEGVPPIVLIARYLLDHPLVLVPMLVPRVFVQRTRRDRYRVLEDLQAVALRLEHLGRVGPEFHKVSRAALRPLERQDRQQQTHRSPRRHLKHTRQFYFAVVLRSSISIFPNWSHTSYAIDNFISI